MKVCYKICSLISIITNTSISSKEVTSHPLDMAVFEFLEVERSEGRCVHNKDLQENALKIADTLDLLEFKASKQWLCR